MTKKAGPLAETVKTVYEGMEVKCTADNSTPETEYGLWIRRGWKKRGKDDLK